MAAILAPIIVPGVLCFCSRRALVAAALPLSKPRCFNDAGVAGWPSETACAETGLFANTGRRPPCCSFRAPVGRGTPAGAPRDPQPLSSSFGSFLLALQLRICMATFLASGPFILLLLLIFVRKSFVLVAIRGELVRGGSCARPPLAAVSVSWFRSGRSIAPISTWLVPAAASRKLAGSFWTFCSQVASWELAVGVCPELSL